MIVRIKHFVYFLFNKRTRDIFMELRDRISCLRYYSKLTPCRATRINKFYFILDKDFKHHPGLADRLKAITSCYYLAKRSGYSFLLIDQTQCGLSEFLIPEQTSLLADSSELEYSIRDTKLFFYSAARWKITSQLIPGKQYHCYCYQGDDLFYHNGGDYIGQFRVLFNELFTPTKVLSQLIKSTGLEEKQYVAIHARFVNSLGSFESKRYPSLPLQDRERLIERCLSAIKEICDTQSMPVVLFSDSALFLQRSSILPVITLDSTNIAHISLDNNQDALAKTYLDFMLISRAAKVIRLCSNERELHLTNYSYYAAFAGGADVADYQV